MLLLTAWRLEFVQNNMGERRGLRDMLLRAEDLFQRDNQEFRAKEVARLQEKEQALLEEQRQIVEKMDAGDFSVEERSNQVSAELADLQKEFLLALEKLRKKMKELGDRLDDYDFSVEEEYENVMGQVHHMEREWMESRRGVSEEWARLMDAFQMTPKTFDPNNPPKPANLKLIIDAIDRIAEEDQASGDKDSNEKVAAK